MHLDQVRDRACAHLLHDIRTMYLHGAFTQTEADGDDLVCFAIDDECHHFALSGRERVGALLQIGQAIDARAILGVQFQSAVDPIEFVAAAIRDTSESRIVKDEFVAARKEADRANRAKSRFLATASHDLRQPMQTIRLLNSAMMKMVPEPDVRELLLQQGQAIESMIRLLNALLDISRLESGAIEPVSVAVSISDVFEELRSEFSSMARAESRFAN